MILASIKPYYYYLIAEEKKKIEVRKTALKNLPQDIAFYMSKDEKSFAKIPKEFQDKYRKHFGKRNARKRLYGRRTCFASRSRCGRGVRINR